MMHMAFPPPHLLPSPSLSTYPGASPCNPSLSLFFLPLRLHPFSFPKFPKFFSENSPNFLSSCQALHGRNLGRLAPSPRWCSGRGSGGNGTRRVPSPSLPKDPRPEDGCNGRAVAFLPRRATATSTVVSVRRLRRLVASGHLVPCRCGGWNPEGTGSLLVNSPDRRRSEEAAHLRSSPSDTLQQRAIDVDSGTPSAEPHEPAVSPCPSPLSPLFVLLCPTTIAQRHRRPGIVSPAVSPSEPSLDMQRFGRQFSNTIAPSEHAPAHSSYFRTVRCTLEPFTGPRSSAARR